MSQENVEIARAVLATLGDRDAERLVALADPDVEWHSLFALGARYRGHEGARQYMADLGDAWDIGRAEPDCWLAVEDVVLLVGHIHFRGKGSGIESTSPVGWMIKIRSGKVIRFRAFRDPAEALEAVGLSE